MTTLLSDNKTFLCGKVFIFMRTSWIFNMATLFYDNRNIFIPIICNINLIWGESNKKVRSEKRMNWVDMMTLNTRRPRNHIINNQTLMEISVLIQITCRDCYKIWYIARQHCFRVMCKNILRSGHNQLSWETKYHVIWIVSANVYWNGPLVKYAANDDIFKGIFFKYIFYFERSHH